MARTELLAALDKEWTTDTRALASAVLSGHRARQQAEPGQWEPWELSQCRREIRALMARIYTGLDYADKRKIEAETNRLQQRYSPPTTQQ